MNERHLAGPDESRARRAAFGSFVGAVIDWYDFILYGLVAALVFNKEFFPNVSPAIGTLAAFATFGVGFLFRPLGGVVFGHFGDRLGRKRMLVLTIVIMGSATALIGLLPSFASIGWWAPVLLVTLRAVQGFAVGGEWGGAALMAVESAPPKKKALYSSGVQVGYSVGLILATGFVMLMSSVTTDEAFTQWGWRVPFVASIVLVAFGLWVRSSVEESQEFTEKVERLEAELGEQSRKRIPLVEALTKHPKAFLQIIGLRFVELFSMYIVTTFALSYSTNELGMERSFMLNVGLLVGALGMVTIPLFAWLSDRYGRRRVYMLGSALGAVCAFPFFAMLEGGSMIGTVIFAVLLVNIAHDMVVSVQQPLFTEMFGAEYRYSGAGVGYQVASAVGGGFTPFIAAALVTVSGGSWHLVAVYLAGGCVISGIIAWRLGHDHGDAGRAARASRTSTVATAP
ncbi:permeases of the major facilitator superfamily [Rhodococcus aetherivorans]|uniref:Permeases of the major facilitator superfamily n=1 Tax=Rhodococcus aetherivorans TaxID=191292 RepID=A0ABQ0YGH5_9NOCA|nr:shikimate transporter [Rhodococcus aetherivorans]ETT28250.1 metabolite/H+ symporter, major facilitator superfamily (MFS) [Rhodococcus rhodochrous ATCC 21198]MDV6295631.1 shikimate transporter [Rhodococcus aetherivorans]NGP25560.1 shikimate transporter [Rhodococcus aetherivorans]GES35643.1 permeases of the major facilitator superfamily [Rhodococcus aetherivorans]